METSSTVRGGRADAELVALEKVAQTVAVDEVDRRRAIAGGFLLGVGGERAGSDQQACRWASRSNASGDMSIS